MSVVFIFQTSFIMSGLLDGPSITVVLKKVDVSMVVGGSECLRDISLISQSMGCQRLRWTRQPFNLDCYWRSEKWN